MQKYVLFTVSLILFGIAWEWLGLVTASNTLLPLVQSLVSDKDLSVLIPKMTIHWGGQITYTDQHDHFLLFLIRKSVHLFGYGVLTLIIWYFVHRFTTVVKSHRYWIILFIIVILAFSDEYIQSFSPLRTVSFMDILLDFTGTGISLTALWLIRGCKWS